MKKFRKLLSLVLAMVMVLAMAAPSYAEDEYDGKITISNATKDQDYAIYRIFDANPSGEEDLIAYTATAAQKQWFERQTGNIFDFQPTAIKDPVTSEVTKYNVTLKNGLKKDDKVVIDFLKGLKDLDGFLTIATQEGETKTATSATVVFDKIPYGYYLVTSSLGAVVSVDSTNKEVEIIDKNQTGPSWNDGDGKKIVTSDGKVETTSVNYGASVDFEVKFHTTNYNGEKGIVEYSVKDELDSRMSYVMVDSKPDVTVKVGSETLTTDKYNVSLGADSQNFTITIPWYDEDEEKFLYESPNEITVTYSATVDDGAEITGEGMTNKATFSYKDEDGKTTDDPTEKTTTTYTYALAIYKSNKEGEPLPGASFTLTDAAGDNVNVVEVTAGSGVYKYDTSNSSNKSNEVVSPESGVIEIRGVAAGTYTVTEIKAPEGYNLLDESKQITATLGDEYTSTIYYNDNGDIVEESNKSFTASVPVVPIVVVNVAGALLPSTGGIGTTIFYAAGIVLMAGAVFFVIRRKRA